MCRTSGIVLEAVEQAPAVEVGQAHVEGDGVGPELARRAERVGAAQRDHDLEAVLAARLGQQIGERHVVLDHQQHPVARLHPGAIVGAASSPRARPARARSTPAACAAPARTSTGSSGRYSVKMLPTPGVLCSRSSPPSSRAISRLIARPSPVPP